MGSRKHLAAVTANFAPPEKTTLIGGADVTDRGGFHTDSTQNAGASRSNLRHPGKATAARMPMKTQNDAMTTETPPAPPRFASVPKAMHGRPLKGEAENALRSLGEKGLEFAQAQLGLASMPVAPPILQ